MCAYVRMYVCVCVRERERERECGLAVSDFVQRLVVKFRRQHITDSDWRSVCVQYSYEQDRW
jgi:hypothetical protein